jgi:hypothetical protein
VAGGELEGQEFPFLVDHPGPLEAVAPADRGFAPLGALSYVELTLTRS